MNWNEFQSRLLGAGSTGIALDWSRVTGLESSLPPLTPKLVAALRQMAELEAGAMANPDEHRMVGHYWLRAPERAPTPAIGAEIRSTIDRILQFAQSIHSGVLVPPEAPAYRNVLLIGIGGSALGPQLVHAALGTSR
ncbi:MAG: glucose-6-phosphate isomerase, partial [bacterium]